MDHSIVEICSPHKSIEISLSCNPVQVPYFTSLKIQTPTETIFEKTYSDYSVVSDFSKILEIPDLKIELLDIGGHVFDQDHFLDRLIKSLEDQNLKIHVETVHFHSTNKDLVPKHLELLKYFDAESLYGIEINTGVSEEILHELTKLEQWKKAKKLTIMSLEKCKNPIQIEDFLHFEKMYLIDNPKISPEDCWKIIQSHRAPTHPRRSLFDINGDETKIDVQGVINLFDIPKKCEEMSSESVKHIQHFHCENDLILEVRLYDDRIWGRKGTMEDLDDFW